jgi:hypothetical protein
MGTKARVVAFVVVLTTTVWGLLPEAVEEVSSKASTSRVQPDRATGGDASHFVFHGATPAQADKMRWAIGRFGDMGLELPSLDIHFATGCQERFGAWGWIQTDSTPPWRIEVCTTGIYLHELAHAWDCWNLTDTVRRMFLDLRGLDAWRGDDIPWAKRGEEELASLVARVVGQGVDNYHSADRQTDLDHFEQITGVPVPVVQIPDPSDAQSRSPQY